MEADRVVARIQTYLEVPSVVGAERPFVEHLRADLRARGLEVLDRPGVLVARGDGPGTVSAHIDRHGLVVNGDVLVYAAAYAKAQRYGEPLRPSRKQREAICGRFQDEPVYAYHASTGERIAEGMVVHAHYCGLEGPELSLDVTGFSGVPDGTPVAFAHRCRRTGARVAGQLDNVASAAIVAELFDRGFTGTALLTTEEEIGHSWEHLAAWFGEAGPVDDLIVLDTSPFDEPGPVDAGTVVLRNRDAVGAFNPALVAALQDAAGSYVMKDEVLAGTGKALGNTELGRLVAGSPVTGATVQIPTTDYHTNEETTSVRALAAVVEVVLGALS